MSKLRNWRIRNVVQIDGDSRTVGSETVTILLVDASEDIVIGRGATVPTADTAGYAKGALFIKTDAADGTKGLYENVGTVLLSDFNLIGDISSAEISDGAITLAKLAAIVAPSHVVKYAGKHTTAGGDANEQATVTGAVATDIVIATVEDSGTNTVTLLTAAPGTDVVNFVLSGDPSTDAIISYTVFRATA